MPEPTRKPALKQSLCKYGFLLWALLGLTGCALFPELNLLHPEGVSGVHCVREQLCLDDLAKQSQAEALYAEAYAFVQALPGGLQQPPRVVMCSAPACYQAFGFKQSAGSAVAPLGIVISPRGWHDYYLRHEMIHLQQFEKLGFWGQHTLPPWLKEGMAYALSADPREPLAEPLQSYRQRFRTWYQTIDQQQIWQEIQHL